MKKEELDNFLNSSPDDLALYETRLRESFVSHSRLVNRYVVTIVVLCTVYLLSEIGNDVEFGFLGMNLGSNSPLKQFYPAIISVLFLLAVKASKYLANLIVVYKIVFSKKFKIKDSDPLTMERTVDQFSRLILPFRPFLELMYSTGSGCRDKIFNFIFMGIPLMLIQLTPIGIVLWSSWNILINDKSFIEYILFVIQTLLLIIGIVTFFKYIIWGLKFNKLA